MEFICSRTELCDAVSKVSRAVSAKSSIEALEGILLRTGDDKLFLSGYDLELGISTSIEARVKEKGEIVLSAKLFSDMVRKLPDETVSISCDDKLLTEIKCKNTRFTILGIPSDDFPDIPYFEGNEVAVIGETKLKSMINQTIFAVSQSELKPVLTGSKFILENDTMTVISIDGYRLAIRKEKADIKTDNISFIVPAKTLGEVLRLLSDEEDKNIVISVTRKHITFDINGYLVLSRLLEGEFVDFESAIPKSYTMEVLVSTKRFSDMIERASLLITERLKSPVRCLFSDNLIKIDCATSIGKVYDETEAKITGGEVEIGFNNRYMLDALKNSECDEVKIQIAGPLSPIKIVPPEGDDFLFLVLPVRLKN